MNKRCSLHPPSSVAFGTSNPWPGPRLQKQKALICILLGCLQLFSHILKREFQESDTKHLSRKFTEWVYGPVTCSLYDLASVDSYQNNSALEILVYGSDIPVSPITISPFLALMGFLTQLSSIRTATRCSKLPHWASCWSQSGRSLLVKCFVWTSCSILCTWLSSQP